MKVLFQKNKIVFSIIGVMFIAAIVYFPTLLNGFVDWDDPSYVYENEQIRELSFDSLMATFSNGLVGSYTPLSQLTYSLDYHFFKLEPFGYHLTNYVINLLVSGLVLAFIYLLINNLKIAFIVSCIYAVHPLHVESVAWISERKDLMCALFYISSLIMYLFFIKRRKKTFYCFCLLLFVLALFSKPMAITLPVVLFLLDYYFGRKMNMSSVIEKTPFLLLSTLFGLIALHVSRLAGAISLVADKGVRMYFTAKAIPFYLYKLFVPVNLSAIYPYHNVNPHHLSEIKYYLLALLLIVVIVALTKKKTKMIIFGASFFLITIIPVLKIVPAGEAFAADRYMYIPSIGLFIILAYFLNLLFSMKSAKVKFLQKIGIIVICFCMLTLSFLTWQRCKVWKNTVTLFSDVIMKYPMLPLPYNNIGSFLAEKGDLPGAIKYFRKAIIVKPGYELAEKNLKRAQAENSNNITDSSDKDNTIKVLSPNEEAVTLNTLGIKQAMSGNLEQAILSFKEAARIDPGYSETFNNLGFAYYKKGDYASAKVYFRKTLEIDPSHEKARRNLNAINNMGLREKE